MPICEGCNDTHRMDFGEDHAQVMCTRCPSPCDECRTGAGGRSAYCDKTPCDCACHADSWQYQKAREREAARGCRPHGNINCTRCGEVAELRRARARIEDLESTVAKLEADLKLVRKVEWWATYRAALTGMHAQRPRGWTDAHESASIAADTAHGPLDGAK